MTKQISNQEWVYVVIQDPNADAQYLGQHDDEADISFIPIFLEKEDALMCVNLMAKDKQKTYEVQAVLYEELRDHAAAGGFKLYLLNKEGHVVEKIS